jgi:hypothetical protein
MRIRAQRPLRVRQPHGLQQVQRAAPDLGASQAGMGAEHFRDLVADGAQRIERRHRFLEDHADALAAQPAQGLGRQPQQILPFPQHLAGAGAHVLGQQPQDRAGRQRFAGAAFTHHTDDFARADVQRQVLQRMRPVGAGRQVHGQVLDAQQFGHGSSTRKKLRIVGLACTDENCAFRICSFGL